MANKSRIENGNLIRPVQKEESVNLQELLRKRELFIESIAAEQARLKEVEDLIDEAKSLGYEESAEDEKTK